jgi:CheY-like chemotaxis protein
MNTARIMLIDDDRSWLEALSEYLQRNGFFVLTAADPAEGLSLLRNNNIPLVVCDYDMPGMSGLDLVRFIRQQPRNVAILGESGLGRRCPRISAQDDFTHASGAEVTTDSCRSRSCSRSRLVAATPLAAAVA